MLLGLELLQEFKVCIDTANMKLVFAKDDLKAGIRTCREEIIPPRSQTIVEGRVNTVGLVLAVPFQMENGLAIANSIAKAENNSTPIVVLNPTIKEVKLGKFTQLASAEQIEEPVFTPSPKGEKGVEVVNSLLKLDKFKDNIKVGDQLSQEQVSQLKALISDYSHAFSVQGEIGKTNVHEHIIELMPGAEPVAEPLRRRAQVQIEETRRQVKELLKEGIIEESNSPWAAAYVLAKKKNGEFRLCIDFRKLNLVTKKVVYPLPNIDECLETLSGKTYFSQLDFKSGFWQIAMEKSSKELTAFQN